MCHNGLKEMKHSLRHTTSVTALHRSTEATMTSHKPYRIEEDYSTKKKLERHLVSPATKIGLGNRRVHILAIGAAHVARRSIVADGEFVHG
jgi:hypothetical protein